MAEVKHSTIHVIDGQERGDSPQVWVQPAGKRTPRPGETLVIFLDLASASPSMCADVLRTLGDAYWRAPGGVTTALRLAVKLANDRLIELNRGVPAGQQVHGSLTCAVINEHSLIISQAGPAIAYARARSGAFERIQPPAGGALVGSSRNVEPSFTHFAWQLGDVVVLTGAGSCVDGIDPLIEACMAKGEPRMVAGYLNANIRQGKMVGVALSVEGQPDGVAASGAGGTTAAAPTQSPAALPAFTQPAPAPATSAPVLPEANGTGAGQASERLSQVTQTLSTAGSAAATTMSNAARSVQRSLSAFGGQLLPASTITSAERSRAVMFGLAAVAVLLPILVALAVSVLYFQFSGEAERQQLQNAARTQVETARAATDPAAIKSGWTGALDAIAAYEAKNPEDAASFAEEKRQAYTQLDQVAKITRITPVTLAELPAASGRRRIGAASLGIYTLDTAANAAEYYVLNAERNAITGKPYPLSFASGATVTGALLDITWATPSSGRWRSEGSVLFGNTAIYEYSAATSQITPIELPAVSGALPGQVASGELYNDTIYLLDNGAGQIWRYTYQNGAFTRADTYFRSAFSTLKDSVDFAIDGAIYVLSRNGAVSKFFGRAPVPFNMTNLPIPLGKVVAIAASGPDQNSGNVFIADAQNGAIFMLSKTGAFLKQYRATGDAFANIEDISIDLTSNTLYIATPTHLYSFKIEG